MNCASTRSAASSNATSSVSRSTSTPAWARRSINRRSCSSCGKISAIRKRTDAAPIAPRTACATCLPAAQRLTAIIFRPPLDDRIGEANLAVQLERARLHGERARRRPRLRRLVDDPHAHAQPRQPQGQHQARRSCADDQDVRVGLGHTHAMPSTLDDLLERAALIEREVEKELNDVRAHWRYRIDAGKVRFEEDVHAVHRRLKQGIPAYLRESDPLHVLVAPVIYSLIVSIAILDLWVSLYQLTCFPIFGIARVRRGAYIVFWTRRSKTNPFATRKVDHLRT